MSSSQKVLWGVFVVLFVIAASELFYIFYYQPFISKKVPVSNSVSRVPVKLNNTNGSGSSFIFSEASDGVQVKQFIYEVQVKKYDFISYTDFLKAVVADVQNCPSEKNCFQAVNPEEKVWRNNVDKDFPIQISGPFVVRLNFYGNKEPSGIMFYGRLAKDEEFWWKGINSIFFGIGDGGKRIHIDAKNNAQEPILLLDNAFDKKIDGVYILFNEQGTSFLVTDLLFNKIAFVDLNKTTGNKFPEGLFPDKQFYIGYMMPPSSDLVVYDFSIL